MTATATAAAVRNAPLEKYSRILSVINGATAAAVRSAPLYNSFLKVIIINGASKYGYIFYGFLAE